MRTEILRVVFCYPLGIFGRPFDAVRISGGQICQAPNAVPAVLMDQQLRHSSRIAELGREELSENDGMGHSCIAVVRDSTGRSVGHAASTSIRIVSSVSVVHVPSPVSYMGVLGNRLRYRGKKGSGGVWQCLQSRSYRVDLLGRSSL
jgi:hypothetical protein